MKVSFVTFAVPEVTAVVANGVGRRAHVSFHLPEPLATDVRALVDPTRVELLPTPAIRLRQPLRQLQACWELVRALNRSDSDLVHLHHGHLWFNHFLPAVRQPLVLTVHDAVHHPGDKASSRTPAWILRRGYRRAERIICHAAAVRNQLVSQGVEAGRIRVIPHPALTPAVENPPPAEQPPLILFFGRIWPYKGLEYLIRAQPLISQAVPSARIAIAGEGEDFARYRALMRNPDTFEVHNAFVSNRLRDELFSRASAVVLPYTEASQSGVVPIAYAHARPVVATRVGGLPEVIEHGQTGLLIAERDAEELADAVIRLLKNPSEARAMGMAGQRLLSTTLSPTAVGDATVAVYEEALGGT